MRPESRSRMRKWITRLWRLFSEAETALSIWEWLVPTKLATSGVAGVLAFVGMLMDGGWSPTLIGLATLSAFTITLWAWNGLTWRRYQAALSRNQLTAGGARPNADDLSQAGIEPEYFRGRDLKASALITDERRITNKTFIDCTISGPAAFWLLRSQITNSEFSGTQDSIVVLAQTDHAPEGAVIVKDCIFNKCRFRSISLLAPKSLLTELQKSFFSQVTISPAPDGKTK